MGVDVRLQLEYSKLPLDCSVVWVLFLPLHHVADCVGRYLAPNELEEVETGRVDFALIVGRERLCFRSEVGDVGLNRYVLR
jgi:hypothetical protein